MEGNARHAIACFEVQAHLRELMPTIRCVKAHGGKNPGPFENHQ
jgi:hypothetical protein